MNRRQQLYLGLTIAMGAVTSACTVTDTKNTPGANDSVAVVVAPAPAATPAPMTPATGVTNDSMRATTPVPPADPNGLRLEVDLAARKLYVMEGGKRTGTHSVAVGSPEWPTRTGEWTVSQVIFNPAWVPPDESWAEERKPRDPGEPNNPLGRAQLIYDPPRSIHGTNAPASIGQAVSHGSIRMANAEIIALGKSLMDKSGAGKDAAWYRAAQENRREKQIVDLPRPVPIRVY